MPKILLDQPIPVGANAHYIVVKHHRYRTSPHKTRWTITPLKELQCFELAYSSGWMDTFACWGVHVVGGVADRLGINSRNEKLLFAKFVDSGQNCVWHGYPADYRRKTNDTPSYEILGEWRRRGLIDKRQIRIIKQGQVCE